MSRKLVVSNRGDQIRYEGEWSPTNFSVYQALSAVGPSPPLENPLYEAISNGSFSFAFNGTSIDVLGLIHNDSPDQVEFNCSIDGNPLNSTKLLKENNAPLCTTSILPTGSHELVVNISSGTHFFLDNLQYVPSDDALLDNATVIISNTDPSISYSSGWLQVKGLEANKTTTTNASVNISFIGERISWFGVIEGSGPQHAHPLTQYSVDRGPMVNFSLPGSESPSPSTDIPNVPFFNTTLNQGSHTLFVRFLGNDSTIPLTLNNLVVANRSEPSDSTSSESPSSSTSFPLTAPTASPSTTQVDDKRRSTVGAAVGGVVGAIVGLTFMALLFIYCRRLKRRKLQTVLNGITPFQMEYTYSSAPHSPAPLTREPGSPNDNSTSQRTRYDTTADVFTRSKHVSLQREESRSSNSSTATSSSFVTSTTSGSGSSTV